ncbi:MAG TPA: tetratricopeptide repeat protein [Planctomycetota bacterium]|nr:tetratricopeptide repeat protein [Planctomycetota bacterium]
MRVRILAFALAAASCFAAHEGGSRERTFVQALEAFDRAKSPEDFRRAAELFESMLQDGYKNGAVYYNLGNAWMKAGEHGRAIAAYRKAQPFRPRDPYLQANLNQALSTAPGKLPPAPQPWWRQVFFWKDWFAIPEKFMVATALGLIAFLLALAALKWTPSRAALNRAALTLAALSVLAGIEASMSWSDASDTRHAVVVKETIARKGNSAEYQAAFDQPLKDGAEFTVLEQRGDWVFGHFEGAGDAWVPRDAIVQ